MDASEYVQDIFLNFNAGSTLGPLSQGNFIGWNVLIDQRNRTVGLRLPQCNLRGRRALGPMPPLRLESQRRWAPKTEVRNVLENV